MAAYASLACSWASDCPCGDSAVVLHDLMKARLIGSKFEGQGITLSRRELDQLAEHLQSNGDVPFRPSLRNWWRGRGVSIDVGELDSEEIGDRFDKFIDEGLEDLGADR